MGERIFIIIDGSNFYHRLKETGLSGLLDFNYKEFAQFLLGERKSIASNYYIGFSSKPSFGLIAHTDVRRLLIKDELSRFLR